MPGTPVKQILLLGHTHHDVGYTNSPRLIDDLHAHVVREVLDLCDAHPGEARDGSDAFRWTFEVARPVLRFLRDASAADVERLRARVADGRISVTGGYLNMTQLPGEWEFDAAYDALARIADAGIPVRTEQHGDVNGIAWGTVDGMRRAGISRLVMALNPDHGRAPFTQPSGFWWTGPSGARVFVWLSTHYGFGEEWGIVDGDVEEAERRIAEFVAGLEARDDYPYDTALVHAGNDNRWPTAAFLDVVRHWNSRHPERPMRTTTIDEALDVLEPQATAAGIPVVTGEWSDWWSHGHGSTAREVAVYREARSFARAAQTQHALARLRGGGEPVMFDVMGYRRGPVRLRDDAELDRDLERVDEQLLLFGEHTWGSWETYSKPFSTFSHSHWNAKAGMAYEAYDRARDLAIEGWYRAVASGAETPRVVDGELVVLNPTGRARTETVSFEVDKTRRARAVVTVPPFGTATAPVPSPVEPRTASVVEGGRYRVEVEPARGGVVSLVDTRTGRELVDRAVGHGLGAVVMEEVVAGSEHPMVTRDPKDFHPDFPGPDFEHLVATGDAPPEVRERDGYTEIRWRTTPPGLPEATTTLVLTHDSPWVEVEVELVKPERFGPESIFVAFPFLVGAPEFLLETAGAVYAADREQLPDTSQDWFSVQHAVGVAGEDSGILWGSLDAPLVQLGGFHTGTWARHLAPEGGAINSWLMNNLHFTNFQARQEGTRRYRYRFAPTDARPTKAEVRLLGHDLAEPLQSRVYTGPLRLDGGVGLRVEPAGTVISELRPLADGRVRLRLRNIGSEPVDAEVTWPGVFGAGTVPLAGHGVADVFLDREDRAPGALAQRP